MDIFWNYTISDKLDDWKQSILSRWSAWDEKRYALTTNIFLNDYITTFYLKIIKLIH